ncbi:MAG TPA: hypothetical protein VFL77_09120 [Solirubrobacterales bacterium]|nr:hypothetical protein [Solirubrobacterales bacterium]
MYDRIGRASLKFAFLYLRRRYRREARIAFGLGLLAAFLLAYLASREVPEG